jgi:replicative DNA helicase
VARDFNNRDQFLERPLPSNTEGERAILGAILLNNQLLTQAIEQLSAEDFYSPFHRAVFSAMIALFERGLKIDPILIGEELKKEGKLESYGGVAAIANLTYGLPHFNNIFHYAKLVAEKALARNLIKACNSIVSEALAEEEDAEIVLDRAEQLIFALANKRTKQSFVPVRPVAEDVFVKIQEYAQNRDSSSLTGLTTGFRDLDSITSGMQKSDLLIIAARPSMGKCLCYKELLAQADGSLITVEEIYKRKKAKILTLKNNYKFAFAEPSNFVDDGVKPVFRVTTKLGRQIETTITHPFLTIEGWKRLEELKINSKIAVPRIINIFGSENRRECEVKLLAYLLCDGCLKKNSPEFTVDKEILRDDFRKAFFEFGGVTSVCEARSAKNRALFLRLKKSVNPNGRENKLKTWLESLGILGCDSRTKFVPDFVFRLKRELLATFLNRLFSINGWVRVLTSEQAQIGFASFSETMCRQIQHLLLRFGVVAKLKKCAVKYKKTRREIWRLEINDAKSIKTFIAEIGIFDKESALKQISAALENRKYKTNNSLILTKVREKPSVGKDAESHASLAKLAQFVGVLNDLELRYLSDSEIYWDEIVSVEYAGDKQVYDLTIPETHNFVANDICVHNTAFTLNIAQRAAINANAVVGFFSLEMSKEQLVMRLLCSEAMVDAHRFRNGFLTRDEWERLGDALGRLSEAKIFIDDTPGISILEMRAKARRLAAEQRKLDLIIVDYLQLMQGSGRIESRQQEVAQISRELKGLAKELNIPVIALSQLSRASEQRSDHKPQLSDLRESGSIEQDADVVAFIYREEQYKQTEENDGKAEIIIAKQRNGPTGSVKLTFLKQFTRFEDAWQGDGFE